MALTAPPLSRPWRAELPEILLSGGATLVVFPLLWALRWVFGLDRAELAVGFSAFYAAHVLNDPHFSVSYLLFYRDVRARVWSTETSRLQRLRYVVAGFVVPVLLLAWVSHALSQRSASSLGLMIQLMFVLVGWHYVKQGFGVLAVLCLRRGVAFTRTERYVLVSHCFAAWAYAWLEPSDPGRLVEEKGVVYTTIAHGRNLELAGLVAVLLSLALVLVALVQKWRREGRMVPPGPLLCFFVSVWVWTVFMSKDPLLVYVIPALHSLQYLYFVWVMKRNQAVAEEGPPLFGRPLRTRVGLLFASALGLGWLLFHAAPTLLDAAWVPRGARGAREMGDLGVTPFFAAIFAFVNIHHYFMDHVIWRRENPETRYLARDTEHRRKAAT